MRLLALLVLLFVGGPASAEPPCWPTLPPVASKLGVTTPALGTIVYAASPVGLVFGWSCRTADGAWFKVVAGGPWANFAADWLYKADAAMRGTQADRQALWDQYATSTAIDPRLQSTVDAVMAVLPVPPPVVVWRVVPDPFRADKKRLVYTVVNGKRGPAASPPQYVDAGAACDPVTTITEFGPVYFLSVLGNPSLVARCAK